MESFKKERSSRQHMKIDIQNNTGATSQDGLLLANPMACGDVSPGPQSPGSNAPKQLTSPTVKQDVHASLLNSTISCNALSELQGSTNIITHSRTDSFESFNNSGILSRGNGNPERSSFREKSKSRPKSPSLFRFFVKSSSGPSSANGSITNSPVPGNAAKRKAVKTWVYKFLCCVFQTTFSSFVDMCTIYYHSILVIVCCSSSLPQAWPL